MSTAEAFAWCEKLTQSHHENFPVGSLLIPRAKRRHVHSIYAFARLADDFADEGDENLHPPHQRLAALGDWERQLGACYRGQAIHPVFIALAETARELSLPDQLFRDLLSAFKQDVVKQRYLNFAELLGYCRRSANPVGRLILHLFDYRDENRAALADEICTALQLTNFWQDVSVDLKKNRIYLPADEMARFNVAEEDLFAKRFTPEYAALLAFQVARTREMFARGRKLPELVGGRLRYELRLTWYGGMRILDQIEQNGYNTLAERPRITTGDKFALLARALFNLS
jgi:squalene synthase HpnC